MSFDPETGEFIDDGHRTCGDCLKLQAQVRGLKAELANIQNEFMRQLRINAALKTELKRQKNDAPETGVARVIFRYWVTRLGKNPKLTKFGEKRKDNIVKRLRDGYEASYICRAIDGLAEFAFTNSNGVRFDDLELVTRNEVKLEHYHKLAEKREAPTLLNDEWYRQFEPKLAKAEW